MRLWPKSALRLSVRSLDALGREVAVAADGVAIRAQQNERALVRPLDGDGGERTGLLHGRLPGGVGGRQAIAYITLFTRKTVATCSVAALQSALVPASAARSMRAVVCSNAAE
jgi:hypothetical protein